MLLTPEEMAPSVECTKRILDELDRILLGHHDVHKLVLIGILSKGHILLEGLPGVGKTALIKALGHIEETGRVALDAPFVVGIFPA